MALCKAATSQLCASSSMECNVYTRPGGMLGARHQIVAGHSHLQVHNCAQHAGLQMLQLFTAVLSLQACDWCSMCSAVVQELHATALAVHRPG